jgi:hypothetical protein
MFKKIVVNKIIFVMIGLLVFGISEGVYAGKKPAKKSATEEIKQVMQKQEEAWNRGDLDSFMVHYWNSPNLRFVSKTKVRMGWQNVYNNYHENYAEKGDMGVLGFDIKSVELIGKEDAMVVGSWKVDNKNGTFAGHFTLWFKLIDKRWQIILDHTS